MGNCDGKVAELLAAEPLLARRFEVLECLGEGAAGAVFRVRDRAHGNAECALKVLVNAKAFDEHTLNRFRKELDILKRIRHPNLIYAFDMIETERIVAFTMELVKGSDLGKFAAKGRMDYAQIDLIFSQVLAALQELHLNGVVHRDLKLENILIANNGIVKVTDLGLMKELQEKKGMTKTGILLGTAQYLPPEYVKYGDFDERGDIYAVGVMLFECLTGRRWLRDKQGNEAIDHLIATNFEFPKSALFNLPEKYRMILERALVSTPEQRFLNADAMRRALLAPVYQPEPENAVVVKESVSLIEQVQARRVFAKPTRRSALIPLLLILAGIAAVTLPIGFVNKEYFLTPAKVELSLSLGIYKGAYEEKSGTKRSERDLTIQVLPEAVLVSAPALGCKEAKLSSEEKFVCNKKELRFVANEHDGTSIRGVLVLPGTKDSYQFDVRKAKSRQ